MPFPQPEKQSAPSAAPGLLPRSPAGPPPLPWSLPCTPTRRHHCALWDPTADRWLLMTVSACPLSHTKAPPLHLPSVGGSPKAEALILSLHGQALYRQQQDTRNAGLRCKNGPSGRSEDILASNPKKIPNSQITGHKNSPTTPEVSNTNMGPYLFLAVEQ